MFSHETSIRVRYGETDQMGFMYYGNYALYYEVGRVEAIRHLGITYKSLEDSGIIMPVVRVDAKYIHPAQYDDLITVTTQITEMPNRFIVFNVLMSNQDRVLLHKAKITLCFKESKTGNQVRTPALLIEKLTRYFS
ncbi:UNVERIFIED_CONTAM: hypothetical protein GTU68_052328 [Idotea baltica]|nr:hypothetical protein [Idotea baltica]